ncbi:hypothetical protein BC829DRAFT_415836 [Chytridium lagenaria]|nr:hypothetical protein BC829DRAFT_415836 [Chytridium lagenaria]
MLTQGFIALLSLTVSIQAAAPGKIVAIQSPASFCLLLPSLPGQSIGESEGSATSHCVGTSTNGARSLPASVVKQAHYLDGPGYVQITGQIDMAALRISSRDGGGQYDDASWGIEPTSSCAGYDRYLELVGNDVFCIRCCKFSDPLKADYDKSSPCYAGNDLAGCETNIPGAYGPGSLTMAKRWTDPGEATPILRLRPLRLLHLHLLQQRPLHHPRSLVNPLKMTGRHLQSCPRRVHANIIDGTYYVPHTVYHRKTSREHGNSDIDCLWRDSRISERIGGVGVGLAAMILA